MKRTFAPLYAFVLFLLLCNSAPCQTPPRAQITQRVNEHVLFLMGGQPGATFNQLAYDIATVVSDGQNLRVLPVEGGAAVENVEDLLEKHRHGADHPGGVELPKVQW